MDWSDDITYAAHDLEDFYRSNLIPVSKLKSSSFERSRVIDEMVQDGKINKSEARKHRSVLQGVTSVMPRGPYVASQTQRQSIRSFISYLVGKWINSTKFVNASRDRSNIAYPSVESQHVKIYSLNSRVEEPAAPPVTSHGCA